MGLLNANATDNLHSNSLKLKLLGIQITKVFNTLNLFSFQAFCEKTNLGNKYGMFDRQSQCNIQQRSATANHDIDTKVNAVKTAQQRAMTKFSIIICGLEAYV